MKTVIPFKKYVKQGVNVNSDWAVIETIPTPPPECYAKITACFIADNSRDFGRDVLDIQFAIASSSMHTYVVGKGTIYSHSNTKASTNSCTLSYITFPEETNGYPYTLIATSNSTNVLRVKVVCTVETFTDWHGWA